VSQAQAVAFLDRIEADEEFAEDLRSVKDDPETVHARIRAAGFDASPDEIREEFLDRYGAELTPEQLDQVAAGWSDQDTNTVLIVASVIAAAAAGAI
jgi:predicted ribosomally synthesized peptide with nif11-like leader